MADDAIDPEHPLVAFTRGQTSRASYLRDRLTQMADRTSDPELAEVLRDVAAGRRSMRDLAGSDVFGRHAASATERLVDRERERTVEQRLEDATRAQAEVQHALGSRLEQIMTTFQSAVERGTPPPSAQPHAS